MQAFGRTLQIGPTDNTSDQRTPRQPLRLIPPAARASFEPYRRALPAIDTAECDLTRLAPGRPQASGEPIEVSGRVTDCFGRPQRGVVLEIWNANTHGRYRHIEDESGLPLDPGFLGQGHARTDEDGRYRFWTIKPGAYLARRDIGRWRPRHIHLSLIGGWTRLVTQMYFPDDPYNDGDPMRILMGDAFERNLGQPYAPSTGAIREGYRFDIVTSGHAVPFFEAS